jgi:nucleoside-diphosphate-sugar epimerase
MVPLPRSPYAATKVAGEALLKAWCHSYGLDTVSLRYFNIFGPRQSATSAYAAVIAAFASKLLAGQNPVIFGDGIQSRDFTHVANAVHANLLAARREQNFEGEVLNVACGIRVSVSQLALSMAREAGREDLAPTFKPARTGDVLHSQASLDHARKELNYEPIVGLEEGIRETVEWYRTQV